MYPPAVNINKISYIEVELGWSTDLSISRQGAVRAGWITDLSLLRQGDVHRQGGQLIYHY